MGFARHRATAFRFMSFVTRCANGPCVAAKAEVNNRFCRAFPVRAKAERQEVPAALDLCCWRTYSLDSPFPLGRYLNQPTSLSGTSSAIKALLEEIDYAARSDAKVLIGGESGAGKAIVARLIHASGRRRQAPLVTVNCAALTETLLETELFGHVRGSFTGAYRDKAGVFERANGGTVFMDEIGETTPRMQGLLLRFLETGEIQRVGSDDRAQARVDVRVIAATNRVLLDDVAAKTFREDLYYRLNVIHLRVPSLRDRRHDVPIFIRHFFDVF